MTKGLKDWFPVFKAGTHKDSKGREHTFTTSDLDKIVASYNSDQEAPCVIGHPEDDHPAFGWIESVKREGELLYAKCKDTVAEFEKAVKDGLYPNRSISINPNDFTINHLGFLGAVKPAIKGLGKIAFSQNDDIATFDFSAGLVDEISYNLRTIGSLFQKLREFLIEKYGIEETDKVLWAWDINNLLKDIDTEKGRLAFCEKFTEEIKLTTAKPTNEGKTEFSQADIDLKNQEIDTLKAENEKLKAETKRQEFSAFCDDLLGEGKMTPAQKTHALDFMSIMDNAGSFEFSEGGEKSAIEEFKTFLKSLPKQINFSEVAKGKAAGIADNSDPKELANKALEYKSSMAQKGIEISISEAVKKVKEGEN